MITALQLSYRVSGHSILRRLDLDVEKGETLAIVGESGCGKTTLARAVLGLARPTSGRVIFKGQDVTSKSRGARRQLHRGIQIVFQDPYSSVSPRMTIRDVIAEPLRAQGRLGGAETNARVLSLLETVGLGTQHLWRRRHEFSGGQCQRIAIARALAPEPELLVLDEPTSALDVSVQARILVLLRQLQRDLDLTYLFITHDLAVVESMADQVAIMYLGKVVEKGQASLVLGSPRHPYAVALLESVPSPDPTMRSEFRVLDGDVGSPVNPPSGCRFHPRCPVRLGKCDVEEPQLGNLSDGRTIACHRYASVAVDDHATLR